MSFSENTTRFHGFFPPPGFPAPAEIMQFRFIDNHLKPFVLIQEDDGRLWTCWPDAKLLMRLEQRTEDRSWQRDLTRRLQAYFVGEHVDFFDVPLPQAATFLRRCWEACRAIPRGEVRSYGELAILAGSGRNASRAAGQAMRRNPLPVIVPCHRILAANGQLHGFSGSIDPQGEFLSLKRSLLELEGVQLETKTLFDDPPPAVVTGEPKPIEE